MGPRWIPDAEFVVRSTKLHIVVRSRDAWWVDIEGHPHGPFPAKIDAIEGAIAVAHIFGDEQRTGQVVAQNDAGRYVTVWSSATDPFPPDPDFGRRLSADP